MDGMIEVLRQGSVAIYYDGGRYFAATREGRPVGEFEAHTGGDPMKAQVIAEDRIGRYITGL